MINGKIENPINIESGSLLEVLKNFYEENLIRAGILTSKINLDIEDIENFGRIRFTFSHKEQAGKYQYGIMFEFLKTILSPLIFPGYIAIRTNIDDDKETGVDEFLIKIENREVVLYINDKAYHEGTTRVDNPHFGSKEFLAHPFIGQNNRVGFRKERVEINNKNFSFLYCSHRDIIYTYKRILNSRNINSSIAAILNFLNALKNENRKDTNLNSLFPIQYTKDEIKRALIPEQNKSPFT